MVFFLCSPPGSVDQAGLRTPRDSPASTLLVLGLKVCMHHHAQLPAGFCLLFSNKISHCSPDWSGMCYLHQAGFKLKSPTRLSLPCVSPAWFAISFVWCGGSSLGLRSRQALQQPSYLLRPVFCFLFFHAAAPTQGALPLSYTSF